MNDNVGDKGSIDDGVGLSFLCFNYKERERERDGEGGELAGEIL